MVERCEQCAAEQEQTESGGLVVQYAGTPAARALPELQETVGS